MMYRTEYMAPVGRLTLIADEEALLGLWIQGQQYEDEAMWGAASILRETRILADACGWLDRYFAGEKPVPGELPLHPPGQCLSSDDLGDVVPHSLWPGDNLWGFSARRRISDGERADGCAGRGRRCRS